MAEVTKNYIARSKICSYQPACYIKSLFFPRLNIIIFINYSIYFFTRKTHVMETFIATIMLWPCDWAPRGWVFCSGQTLNIQSYSALFSLLGTKFGGDGITNFKLPEMQNIKTESGAEVRRIICLEGIYPSRD
jgi:hypothetical protein